MHLCTYLRLDPIASAMTVAAPPATNQVKANKGGEE